MFRMPNQNKVIRHTSVILTFTVKITAITDSLEDSLGDKLCGSLDFFNVSLSEISTSPKSITEEDSVLQSCSQTKGKAKAKRAKTIDIDASTGRQTTKRIPPVKKQKANTSSNDEEVEDLTSWIFSPQEETREQEHLTAILLNNARMKDEQKWFAEHLLCDAEKHHFQLLLSGFCQSFLHR